MSSDTRKETVRRTIVAAFASTPAPDPKNISTPTYDDEGVQDYFAGKDWRGHSVRMSRYHSSALTVSTPEACRYFLPAFLVASLDDPEEADVIPDCICWSLIPDQAIDYEFRRGCFSAAEREAIGAFVRYRYD